MDHKNSQFYNSRAVCYQKIGEFEKAVKDFEKAFELDNQVVYLVNAGQTYERLSQVDSGNFAEHLQKAILCYTAVSQKTPGDFRPHINIANVYSLLGDNVNALKHYAIVTQLDPGNIDSLNGSGMIYLYQMRDYEAASKVFETIIQSQTQSSIPWYVYYNASYAYEAMYYKDLDLKFVQKAKVRDRQDLRIKSKQ
jgi:tetratricopeptide (TPR) repeat protein